MTDSTQSSRHPISIQPHLAQLNNNYINNNTSSTRPARAVHPSPYGQDGGAQHSAPPPISRIPSTTTTPGGVAGRGGSARNRPSSSSTLASSQRPTSSSPSLLSLEVLPSSPATASSLGHYNQQNKHSTNSVHKSHRHKEHQYDADFDRAIGHQSSTPVAGPSSGHTTHPSASSSRTHRPLFNPNAPPEPPSSRRKDKERDDSRRSRSKRDPVEAADLGARTVGKESKDSFESEESRDSGRPPSRSSKDGRRRRREGENGRESRRRNEGEAAAQYEGLHGGSTSTIANNSARQLFDPRRDDPVRFTSRGNPVKGSGAASLHSFASSAASIYSTASGQDPHAQEETASANSGNRRKDGDEDPNSFVTKLRKAYREITEIEQRLQDEHKATLAAQHREEDPAPSVRIQGTAKRFDDDYWVRLAVAHKQLADAHYSFLQLALDPKLPPSTHSLPTKYNIPIRLWQTGFHQLLERMRHAVTASPLSAPSDSSASVLEHLIEFIQYAYGFYSQLFEDPSVGVFRPAWIEQLGDLARYRMAVAGLAARVAQQQAASSSAGGTLDLANHGGASRGPRPLDAASIGEAAMGDWELEEQETWRDTARDWYGQGVAETPGTGRLQHHLALLSKGDEMRGLYHYVKSLCATHPYVSARESILPLFEDEHQARRTAPDVTKTELFVHLHGMLFTKISLDDFDDCYGRLVEQIAEDAAIATRNGGDWAGLAKTGNPAFGDADWFMVAVTNIGALLQYGQEDGILRSIANKAQAGPGGPVGSGGRPPHGVRSAPQAIMLNSHAVRRDASGMVDDDDDSPTEDVLLALGPNTGEGAARPLPFVYAKKLAFDLLAIFLRKPWRPLGDSRVVNPYITLLLTFLGHEVQHPAALRELERSVPWQAIVDLFNSISDQIDIRLEGPIKLTSGPLPEDWCIRGMDWTGRHLFGRGYWKPTRPTRAGPGGRDDMGGGRTEGGGAKSQLESEAEALKFDLDAMDDYSEGEGDVGTASAGLASARWRRLATIAAWFVRFVPGFDFDPLAPHGQRFSVTGPLEAKLGAWAAEDRQTAEAEKASRLKVGRAAELDVDDEDESEDEEDDDDDENDTPVVRELKLRRRQLKAVIRQAKLATRHADTTIRPVRFSGGGKQGRSQRAPAISVFPGYTVLVFDTNILLSSMKLFRDLVEREKWTIVVPLAVVTELDGLKRNASPLGLAAVEAISYLEAAIRSHARFLKVQTSRGNYLRDLSVRSEAIDFNADAALSSDAARSMDDVILRAATWQRDHFQSRLALVNPRADRRAVPGDCAEVVLVSFDGNLRLKARARGLEAVDEKGMGRLLEASEGA